MIDAITGYRIGKGEGFADLMFAMMRAMEAVDDDIIVVSTVHDCQVVDIPDELIKPHDLTVDYIVTPTEIIHCERRPKPKGIVWSMLTNEKLLRVPILRKLRDRQQEAGIDVTLKDGEEPEANDNELDDRERDDRRQRDRRRRRRNTKERRDSERAGEGGEHSESGEANEKEGGKRDRRNNTRRRRRKSSRKSESERGEGDVDNEGESGGEVHDKENIGGERRQRPPRHRRRRSTNKSKDGERSGASGDEEKGDHDERDRGDRGYRNREGGNREDRPPRRRTNGTGPLATIYVGSLPKSLRVSEFKAQVRDKGVNPLRVIWHGASGHAFLQFQKMDEAEGALDILHSFEIEGKALKIEMSRRTSKIAAQGESEPPAWDKGKESEVKGAGSD